MLPFFRRTDNKYSKYADNNLKAMPFFGYHELPDEPSETLGEFLTTVFTPFRTCLLLGGIVVACLGLAFLDPDDFRVMSTLHNVKDERSCRTYCYLSHNDAKLMNALGGKGLCDKGGEGSLVSFQWCDRVGAVLVNCEAANGTNRPLEKHDNLCTFPVTPDAWKPYGTLLTLVFVITLVLQGAPAGPCFVVGSCILCVAGIISSKECFAGFANGGTVGIGVLMVVIDTVQHTHVPDKILMCLLGRPTSLKSAIPRLMIPVACLSAITSNTAIVMILIPIIQQWARRIGCCPSKLYMPLAYSSSLGGLLTVIGCSSNMVAQAVIPESRYKLGFFSLLPIGLLLTCLVTIATTALAPTGLLAAEGAAPAPQDTTAPCAASKSQAGKGAGNLARMYNVRLLLSTHDGGSLVVRELGLPTLKGVYEVRREGAPQKLLEEETLEDGQSLVATCTREGVVALRYTPQLDLANAADLAMLGEHYYMRRLYEVIITKEFLPTSSLPSLFHSSTLESHVLENYGAGIVAGPIGCKVGERLPEPGDTLLLEADPRYLEIKEAAWNAGCARVDKVPQSAPPRTKSTLDNFRVAVSLAGFGMLIALSAANVVELAPAAGCLVGVMLVLRCTSIQKCYRAINGSLLLVLAGSIGVASAAQNTGVASFLANAVVASCKGNILLLSFAIHMVAVVVSAFMSNSACVAMMVPIIIQMADQDPSIKVKNMIWILLYGAGACYTTPIGTPVNLLVQKPGGYSFGDYVCFGTPLQMITAFLTILFVQMLADYLPD